MGNACDHGRNLSNPMAVRPVAVPDTGEQVIDTTDPLFTSFPSKAMASNAVRATDPVAVARAPPPPPLTAPALHAGSANAAAVFGLRAMTCSETY